MLLALAMILAACGGAQEPAATDEAAPVEETEESDDADDSDDADEANDADDGEAFYEGETIEVIVPYGAGGGTDIIGRFLAEWYSQFIDGEPTVQVINVPGGGSIVGANQFELQSPRDGSVLMLTASSNLILAGLGHPEVRYDPSGWVPVLGGPQNAVVFVRSDLGLEEDSSNALDLEYVAAMREAGGVDLLYLIAYDLLGIDVNPVFGYESAGATRTALEQGESNIEWSSTPGYLQDVVPQIEAGDLEPWFTMGVPQADGSLGRPQAHPDLPTIEEVYEDIHGEAPSGEKWDIYRAMNSVVFTSQRVLWLHDDAPQGAIDAWTDASVRLSESDEFMEAAFEVLGPYDVLVGDDLEAIRGDLTLDPGPAEYVLEFLRDNYDYELGG